MARESWRKILHPDASEREDPTRRNLLEAMGAGTAAILGGPTAVNTGRNAASRVRSAAGEYSIRSPVARREDREDTTETDTPTETPTEEPSDEPTETPADDFEYTSSDLPYHNIFHGLDSQTEDALIKFDDFVVNAYNELGRSVSETVENAFLEVEDATAEEYLRSTSSEREDMDVYLGFDEIDEELNLGDAGLDEDFEEYMAGIEYLGEFEDEMRRYAEDVEDSFN